MCGRYRLSRRKQVVEEHFAAREIRAVEWDKHAVDDNF
jgi:putative SOS response-associated peptidase YedK